MLLALFGEVSHFRACSLAGGNMLLDVDFDRLQPWPILSLVSLGSNFQVLPSSPSWTILWNCEWNKLLLPYVAFGHILLSDPQKSNQNPHRWITTLKPINHLRSGSCLWQVSSSSFCLTAKQCASMNVPVCLPMHLLWNSFATFIFPNSTKYFKNFCIIDVNVAHVRILK